jgi:hypothetical protein
MAAAAIAAVGVGGAGVSFGALWLVSTAGGGPGKAPGAAGGP